MVVSANAQAMACFRLAVQPGQDPEKAHRCRAQAAAMMRGMQSGLRALLRMHMQETREKAEAALHPAAMERAGYWFHDVSVPAPCDDSAPLPEPSPAQPEPPQPVLRQPSAPPPDPGHAKSDFSNLTEAEQYAVLYPARTRHRPRHRRRHQPHYARTRPPHARRGHGLIQCPRHTPAVTYPTHRNIASDNSTMRRR